jgi:hypothetical protein
VAHVELLTPPRGQGQVLVLVQGRARYGHGGGGLADGGLENVGGELGQRRGEAVRAGAGGGGVQADDRVEVDRAAPLVLRYLGERDPDQPPQLGLAEAGELGQRPVGVGGGPRPQPPRHGVPQHLGARLVAARAQRLPQPGIVVVVALPAAHPPAVRAPLPLPVGVAGEPQQALGLPGMDPAEGGSGEGDEQPRMPAHGLGDALAAAEAGGQELEAVGLVGRRARRGAAVAARLEQGASGSRSVA